jgi:hypothetical protein
MYLPPLPVLAFVAVAIALGLAWWWSTRLKVSPEPIALMVTRVGFPKGMRVHDVDKALAMIEKPDEIVIPFEHATLVIDFPLTLPATIAITAAIPQGFTRGELVRAICDEYQHVYDAEEGTAHTKPVPREERGERGERNRTDGAYGIWGHDLEELVLNSARWVRQSNDNVRIELHVEAHPVPTPHPDQGQLPAH